MQIDPPQLFTQQRIIHQLQEELRDLRNTNHQIKSQLQHITQQRNNLITIQQKDPIRMILHGLDDPSTCNCIQSSNDALNQRIHFYQQKNLILQQQVRELRNYLNHRDVQILDVNRQLQAIRQKETSLMNQNHKLTLENQSLKKHKNELIETVGKYNSKWQQLADQINQAKIKLMETNEYNHQELLRCNKSLDLLRNSWLSASNFLNNEDQWKKQQQSGKVQQLTDKLKIQSQIMQQLGRQLDFRNQEISQIHNNQKKNSQTNPFDTYQHSLHLMLRSTKQRQRHYTELLKEYQQISENYKESIKQKEILQSQYTKLKELYEATGRMEKDNKTLKRQLQKAREDLIKSNEVAKQLVSQCDTLLKENDAFFYMMRGTYGSEVFQQKINEEKRKYEQRCRERISRELWGNTIQLIEMNQKLKQKLRNKHL